MISDGSLNLGTFGGEADKAPPQGRGKRMATPRYEAKKVSRNWLTFNCFVDYTSKLSNLLEDFKKLDDFAQYIENQGK